MLKKRTLRDGVVMHLIHVAAFWLGRSRSASSVAEREHAAANLRVITEAATALAKKEYWKEADHHGLVLREMENACNVSLS